MNVSLVVIVSIFLAIVLGYKTKINTGIFGIIFAYIIGAFLLDMKTGDIIKMWPISTFFIIFSVSLFYNFAMINGTLEKLSMLLIYFSKSFPRFLPIIIFFVATLIAALGAGYFAVLAFFGPITLLLCDKTGTNKLIGAISVNYGALVGGNFMTSNLGIIFRTLMSESGFTNDAFGYTIIIFIVSFIEAVVVILALIFTLNRRNASLVNINIEKPEKFTPIQNKTLVLSLAMMVIVLIFPIINMFDSNNAAISFINSKIDVGLMAIIFAMISLLMKLGDEKQAILKVPWSTIIMICGIGMLIQVAVKSGTIEALSSWISGNLPENLIPFAFSLIGCFMSFFSSTTGVVCPALFPVVPNVASTTDISAVLIFTAIIIGAQSSSISPFSSGGSLILGSMQNDDDRNKLFSDLLFKAVPICFSASLITTFILHLIID